MNGVCLLLERTHITTLQLLAELGADSDRAPLGANPQGSFDSADECQGGFTPSTAFPPLPLTPTCKMPLITLTSGQKDSGQLGRVPPGRHQRL